MIEKNAVVDSNVQKALNKKLWIASLVLLIVGAVGMVSYIIIGVAIKNEPEWLDVLLYVFAFMFAFGLVFLITVNKTNAAALKNDAKLNYMFFEDYVLVTSYKGNENVGTLKIYYKELAKVKETKEYIFLYQTKVTALPLLKSDLSEQEKETLLSWFNNKNQIKSTTQSTEVVTATNEQQQESNPEVSQQDNQTSGENNAKD